MLSRLVRVSHISSLIGCCKATLLRNASAAGIHLHYLPVAGRKLRGSPAYITLDEAAALVARMLPRVAARLDHDAAITSLGKLARKLQVSTRNLRHGLPHEPTSNTE